MGYRLLRARILIQVLLLPLGLAAGGCDRSFAPRTTVPETHVPRMTVTGTSASSSLLVQTVPALRDIYGGDFLLGAAIPASVLGNDGKKALLEKHFTSFTCENEMKPQSLLGTIAKLGADGLPVLDFSTADKFCVYAVQKGFRMRGHTLVWHNQTPSWFFREGYQGSGKEVSADEMLTRMEWYIQSVLGHFQTKFPGLIYAWDVVNEAAPDGGGTWRTDSPWYRIIGPDYVTKAFEYARKYASRDVALYYNDYNLHIARKADAAVQIVAPAAAAGTIDGIGMQGHEQLSDFLPAASFPNGYPAKVESAIRKFTAVRNVKSDQPLRIQITEQDVFLPKGRITDQNFELQAKAFRLLMDLYRKMRAEGVVLDSVTFWGLSDDMSWRADQFPLLFDRENQPKPAFFALED